MLSNDGGDALREYVVWESILESSSADVPAATRTVPDVRATHFWSGDDAFSKQFAATLSLEGPAWDVYLIYDPHASWKSGERPPRPAWWMHQLSPRQKPTAPRLNGKIFREHVDAVLAGSR